MARPAGAIRVHLYIVSLFSESHLNVRAVPADSVTQRIYLLLVDARVATWVGVGDLLDVLVMLVPAATAEGLSIIFEASFRNGRVVVSGVAGVVAASRLGRSGRAFHGPRMARVIAHSRRNRDQTLRIDLINWVDGINVAVEATN